MSFPPMRIQDPDRRPEFEAQAALILSELILTPEYVRQFEFSEYNAQNKTEPLYVRIRFRLPEGAWQKIKDLLELRSKLQGASSKSMTGISSLKSTWLDPDRP